jgi:fluoride exporter
MERLPVWADFLAVALGGGVGSAIRYAISLFSVRMWGNPQGHWGTVIVNLVGCLLIGCLGGALAVGFKPSDRWLLLVRAGMLGGLTTFSSFGLEVCLLAENQRFLAASVHVAMNVLFGLLMVALGFWLVRGYAGT